MLPPSRSRYGALTLAHASGEDSMTRDNLTARALLLGSLLLVCGGATTLTAASKPAPPTAERAAPYTMRGTVRNSAGQPVAGAEVWADNTLFYNMNALGTSDAQGRYSVPLPRQQLGTWRPGGRFKTRYHGEWYDVSLAVDKDTAFSADAGAIRNFTLKISGERPGGGFYGGLVWPYFGGRGGDFEMERVEYTLTPDGSRLDGSQGQPIRRFLKGATIEDVPLGRYTVTARYRPKDGPARDMLLQPRDADTWTRSITIMFRTSPTYGPFADFTVSLPFQP